MSKKTLIATNEKKQELDWLKRMARHNHGRWIDAKPPVVSAEPRVTPTSPLPT